MNRLRAFARINKGRLAWDEVTEAVPPLQSLANSEKPVAKKSNRLRVFARINKGTK